MLRIILVLLLSIVAGIVLASGATSWPLRPGLIGLLALLGSAWLARRHWQRLSPERGPGSPERVLWHGLASYAVLIGHLGASIYQLGPALSLHSLSSHALAIDNWTLVFAVVISFWIARDPEPRQDERDAWIRQRARTLGHNVLLALMLVLAAALAFGGNTVTGQLDQPMLGQLIILLILLQCLLQSVAQLRHYALDAHAEQAAP